MTDTCKGVTKEGNPCSRPAGENGYCSHHGPVASPLGPPPPPPQTSSTAELPKEPIPIQGDKYQIAADRRARAKARAVKTGALPGQRLVAPPKKGFVRRWVNDENTRIDTMLDKGYSFVEDSDTSIASDDPGSRKSMKVGTAKEGGAVRAYLMEIPESFYQEDQAAREKRVQETEDQVRRAKVGGSQGIGSDPSVRNPSSVQDNLLLEE